MNTTAAGRMAACPLRMVHTVKRPRYDGGPPYSFVMLRQQQTLLLGISLPLPPPQRPQINRRSARLHYTTCRIVDVARNGIVQSP